jgi:hypothetical protein
LLFTEVFRSKLFFYFIHQQNAYKLIIDNEGEIATYSKDLKGVESISREHEIVPILESFIKKHLDFSFHGARGILALTGYEGILGYQTHEFTKSSYPQEKDAALKVVNKLKQEGWEFALHGYGHLNTRTISLELLRYDTASWKREVEPLIGKTSIFIYPYGSSVLPEDNKFKALQDEGFSIFYYLVTPLIKEIATQKVTGSLLREKTRKNKPNRIVNSTINRNVIGTVRLRRFKSCIPLFRDKIPFNKRTYDITRSIGVTD